MAWPIDGPPPPHATEGADYVTEYSCPYHTFLSEAMHNLSESDSVAEKAQQDPQ